MSSGPTHTYAPTGEPGTAANTVTTTGTAAAAQWNGPPTTTTYTLSVPPPINPGAATTATGTTKLAGAHPGAWAPAPDPAPDAQPEPESPNAETKTLAGPPAADDTEGVMLALYPDAATAAALTLPGGTPSDQLHLTVAYLGGTDTTTAPELIRLASECLARAPITGDVSGHARFTGGDRDALVALYDSPGLERLRRDVVDALTATGLELPGPHGYTPHLTLGYLDPNDAAPLLRLAPRPVTFDRLSISYGSTRTDLPFLGDPPPPTDAPDTAPATDAPAPDDGSGDWSDPWMDVKAKPFRGRPETELARPHPYRRHPNSGAGNCECGATEDDPIHTVEGKGKPFPGAAAPFTSKAGTDSRGGAKNSKGGKEAGPPIATGAYVALGNRKGRVDLVVTTGTVPGAKNPDGDDVQATADSPAARVTEYEPAGNGTYRATGRKFAAPTSRLRRVPPLRTRQSKSLEEALAWAAHAHGDTCAQPAPIDPQALHEVYSRGVKSWPGSHRTTLTAHEWALGRVDAYTATAAGLRPDGYHGDDDLMPATEPGEN